MSTTPTHISRKKAVSGGVSGVVAAGIAGLALVPNAALAQPATFKDLVNLIVVDILNPLVPFLIGVAVVYFLWGVVKYIGAAGNEQARAEGRSVMIYGIVGLFVMVSVWGLVNILVNTFQLNNVLPIFPTTWP